jgi:hypothetical protein
MINSHRHVGICGCHREGGLQQDVPLDVVQVAAQLPQLGLNALQQIVIRVQGSVPAASAPCPLHQQRLHEHSAVGAVVRLCSGIVGLLHRMHLAGTLGAMWIRVLGRSGPQPNLNAKALSALLDLLQVVLVQLLL